MAKETIELNGITYEAKEITFNYVCDQSLYGNITVEEFQKQALPAIRYYIAYCMGTDIEKAGEAVEKHCANGGDINEIIQTFIEKSNASGFFRSFNKTKEKETTKRNPKKKEEATE